MNIKYNTTFDDVHWKFNANIHEIYIERIIIVFEANTSDQFEENRFLHHYE